MLQSATLKQPPRAPNVGPEAPAPKAPERDTFDRVVGLMDLGALFIAGIVFVVAGLPLIGFAAAAGGWILQRLVGAFLQHKANNSDDPRVVIGATAGGAIVRGWIVAGAILAVGVSNEQAGVAAAVTIILVFTVHFTSRLMVRPGGSGRPCH